MTRHCAKLMPEPAPGEIDFNGMRLQQAAELMGKPLSAARAWLNQNGYRYSDGLVRRTRSANEIHDAIIARLNSKPPSEPCWRCGARAGCEHRTEPYAPAMTLGGVSSGEF